MATNRIVDAYKKYINKGGVVASTPQKATLAKGETQSGNVISGPGFKPSFKDYKNTVTHEATTRPEIFSAIQQNEKDRDALLQKQKDYEKQISKITPNTSVSSQGIVAQKEQTKAQIKDIDDKNKALRDRLFKTPDAPVLNPVKQTEAPKAVYTTMDEINTAISGKENDKFILNRQLDEYNRILETGTNTGKTQKDPEYYQSIFDKREEINAQIQAIDADIAQIDNQKQQVYNKTAYDDINNLPSGYLVALDDIYKADEEIQIANFTGADASAAIKAKSDASKTLELRYSKEQIAKLSRDYKYFMDAQKTQEMHEEAASGDWAALTAGGIMLSPANLLGVANTLYEGAREKITGEYRPINTNSAAYLAQNMAKAGQEGFSAQEYGTGWEFAYGVGTSTLQSLYTAYISGSAWAADMLMGANAMTDTTIDMINKGASTQQAVASGVAAGVFEGLFEHLSFSYYFDEDKAIKSIYEAFRRGASDEGIYNITKDVLLSMGINGSEEVFTDIANYLFDAFANGDLSEYASTYTQLLSEGYSPADANRQTAIQFGEKLAVTFLSGAIQGGLMSGSNFIGSAIDGRTMQDKQSRVKRAFGIDENVDLQSEEGFQIWKDKSSEELSKYTADKSEFNQETYDSEMETAKKVAMQYDIDLSVNEDYRGTGTHGSFFIDENGKAHIEVAPDTNAPMQVVKHELTHYIELSDNYGKFDSFVTKQVLNTLEENNSSRTIEAIEADIVADYKALGKELTPEQAHHEFIAKYVEEQLFKNQDAVKSLVNYDFATAKDIHTWLQRTIAKLKGESVSIERLTKAEKMFAQALSEVSKLNSEEVLQRAGKEKLYSIKDIDNYSEDSYNKSGWAIVNDILPAGTARSSFYEKVGELKRGYSFPTDTNGRYIFAVGSEAGINNILVFSDGNYDNPSIDEIIKIAFKNETDIDIVRNAIYREDKYGSRFSGADIELYTQTGIIKRYGKKDYASYGQLRQQGAESQRDIPSDTGLQDGSRSIAKTENNSLEADGQSAFLVDKQNSAGRSFSELTDTEYENAITSGDMETAQRMVDEAAKAAGYTVYLYHHAGLTILILCFC